ncbi:MAG: YlxR family protein [Firmicutes bacterium]|nr:YlxR family protein [Bacillota bacterium]
MTERKVPMRKCVGCGDSRPKREMLRIAYIDGKLRIDPSGKAGGRGTYICSDPACAELAFKKNGFARSLRTSVSREELEELKTEIAKYRDDNNNSEVI